VKPVKEKEHGRPVTGPFIFDHVSFGVDAEDELWTLKDKLEAAGFPVSDVINHGFIHSIYAYDPNGIPIEFSHNVPGMEIRNVPQMRDSAPSKITLEGSIPNKRIWPNVTNPTADTEKVVYPGAGSELFQGKKLKK
jgi:hypothetical protein